MHNDMDLEVGNNNANSLNMDNLVNVSFESLIFPSKNLPPCFYNGNISENLENIYNSYSSNEDILMENFEWQYGQINICFFLRCVIIMRKCIVLLYHNLKFDCYCALINK
jgi:hypothetical protein